MLWRKFICYTSNGLAVRIMDRILLSNTWLNLWLALFNMFWIEMYRLLSYCTKGCKYWLRVKHFKILYCWLGCKICSLCKKDFEEYWGTRVDNLCVYEEDKQFWVNWRNGINNVLKFGKVKERMSEKS